MQSKQALVPKLRFEDEQGKDFPDWEEKKLGEVAEVVGGGTPDSTNEAYWKGDVQWFTPSEIRSKFAEDSKRTISQLGLKKSSARVLPIGAILLTSRATIAEVSIATRECTTNQGFQSLIVQEGHHNEFVYYWIVENKKEFLRKSQGSTFLEISGKEIRKFKIILPTLPEQEKIAAFLTSVDDRIDQLKRKKSLLQDYKKGAMQKLFSQELRFKDEQGKDFPDWEEKKLGELGSFIGGGTPDTDNDDYWKGSVPWISSSDITDVSIINICRKRFITQQAIAESATKVVPKNSILFISRVGVGKLAITEEEICTSQDFCNFTPREDNILYLGYYFLFNQNLLKRYAQGTSIKGITSKELKKIAVHLPSLTEQTKIANFLSSLDQKIEQVDTQITQTQTFKKGLLQQMFV